MKKRLLFLASLFVLFLVVFAVQKPFFMWYNDTFAKDCSLPDYWAVIRNGLRLDGVMAGYLFALPFLCTFVSVWYSKLNLKKLLFLYYAIASLLVSLIFIVDMSLYEFWNFKLDSTVFFYLDSPANAAASISFGFIALRVIIILCLAFIYCMLLLKITPKQLPPVSHRIGGSALMLLIGGLTFIVIRGGVTQSTANVGMVYFSPVQFLNHAAVNPCFSLFSSMGKSEDFAAQFDFFAEDKREALFEGLYPKGGETDRKLLKTTRPNVLIILMEGFGGSFIESISGARDITPNFARLSEEGVYFTNCYANSFRTDRGTVATFSGYLGQPTTSIMKMPAKVRSLSSIAGHLASVGYATDFLYGGDVNFTNTKGYLLGSGYRKITADTDFTSEERRSHAWGVQDGITFDYLFNEITARKDSLWHTAFLTLSSHEPFIVPYHRLEDPIANAFAYTDECLGKFIDRLKQTPAWENLLIVCLPDHGFRYPEGVTHQHPDFYHVPMLWLGGAIKEPARIDKIVNQTDLPATLLGQMNLPYDDFPFSRNVFSTSYTYPFAFFSFNNGFGFRDSTGVSVYDNNSNRIIVEEPAPDSNRLDRGKAILQSLYDDLGSR